MNAEQVARELGISVRTVYRHIKKGTIIATKKKEQELSIANDQIEKLRRVLALDDESGHDRTLHPDMSGQSAWTDIEQRLASLAQSIANLNATIASQTRRINELTSRVAELEAKQSLVPPEQPHTPLYTTSVDSEEPPKTQPQIRTTQPSAGIPSGSLLIADFAVQHGVHRTTMRRHCVQGIQEDRIETIERAKPGGRQGDTERILNEPQQEAAIAFWQRHNVKFSKCSNAECACWLS